MGQQCSTLTCRHVENLETAEMTRVDSPDPVMYDLMRKSIQATATLWNNDDNFEDTDPVKSGRRRPIGQSHLLYKNNFTTTSSKNANSLYGSGISVNRKSHPTSMGEIISYTSSHVSTQHDVHTIVSSRQGMESRSGGKSGSMNKTAAAYSNSSSNPASSVNEPVVFENLPQPLSSQSSANLKCPTRLLIRRRSLRVIEEGGGTHIYAIRYPEDTTKLVLSEQAAPYSPMVQQEQCPPRRPASKLAENKSSDTLPKAPATSSGIDNSNDATDTGHSKKLRDLTRAQDSLVTPPNSVTEDNNLKHISTSGVVPSSFKDSQNLFPLTPENVGDIFAAGSMSAPPRRTVLEWVTVSEEHNIYVADIGLTATQCDELVATTEQVCRGQYAAYTYAKQTLGCREFPILAQASLDPVHTIVHAITQKFPFPDASDIETPSPMQSSYSTTNSSPHDSGGASKSKTDDKHLPQTKNGNTKSPLRQLQLDDREPHIVKYDVTRRERQKLDMHTDKSEWTFLIALSNGCGVDYEGGGTYFECIDATVHIQRGHALVFPGKLRHCGQKITSGLRFLLVGFLVDKQPLFPSGKSSGGSNGSNNPNSSSKDVVRDVTSAPSRSAALHDGIKNTDVSSSSC